MKINAYTIFDSKALTYSAPFFAGTHGEAMRIVQDVANDLNTNVGRHPADFTLLCVGSFDNSSGIVLSADHREHISDIVSLVIRPEGLPFDANPGDASRAPVKPPKKA